MNRAPHGRRYADRPDLESPPDDDYPAFDETLTSGIDDTMRHMQALTDRSHVKSDTQWQKYQLQAFRELTAEATELRKDVAKFHETLKLKASKRLQADFEARVAKDLKEKIAGLWTFATWVIGLETLVLSALCVKVFK